MARPKKQPERRSVPLDLRTADSVWDEVRGMHDAVMRRAFEIFRDRGGAGGDALEDWLAAERDLAWAPAIELSRKNGQMTLEAAVAGFDPEELDVRITPEDILIQSERVRRPPDGDETLYCCEFAPGKMFRSVHLPARIDPEQAKAEYKNGLLRITAPLVEDQRPTSIPIEASRG